MNLPDVIPLAFNSQGLSAFVISKVLPLIMLFIGLGIIAGAKKGRMGEVMNTAAIVVIGCVIIGGAGLIATFGGDMARLIFS